MNFSLFLLIGLGLSVLLAWRPKIDTHVALLIYWSAILAWALQKAPFLSLAPVLWSKDLGIQLCWHADGLARLFTTLISGIGLLIFCYARVYAQGNLAKSAKLLSILQIFAISMLGIVLSDDLLVLFLTWELTTVTSYLLIQFDVTDKKANQAAFNGMFISVIGGLAMLAGFILIHQQTHSWSIQTAIITLQGAHGLNAIFYLLLLGAVTKSAQFPFYFWLPGAMKAPTPVSAYLHSATMVNAGIYLLARFHPLLSSLSAWYPALAFFGISTMLISSVLSLFQRDLKSILAYTTLFALGTMVYLLASRQWLAAEAFSLFLLFHGLYKAAAFMWVGNLDLTYGTRDLHELRGIGKRSFWHSIIAVVSLSAMAGLPPFFGFAVKEMIYETKLSAGSISYSLMALGILSSMLIAAASLKCLYYWFFGRPKVQPNKGVKIDIVSPMLLAITILALEWLAPSLSHLLTASAKSIVQQPNSFESPSSFDSTSLSIVTIAGGIILLVAREKLISQNISWPRCINPLYLFEKSLESTLRFGRHFTLKTQRQGLEKQLFWIMTALIIWLAAAFWNQATDFPAIQWHMNTNLVAVLSVLLIITGGSLLLSQHFLMNLISLALFGLVMSGLFVLQGAPDVAMTQLLVEVLTVIVLVVALRKSELPIQAPKKTQKLTHGILTLLIGFSVSALLWLISSTPFNSQLSDYFIKHSLHSAHGRNVVNVILVDFRAFDTFGEALLILGTALAIWLLIDRKFSPKWRAS